MELAKRCFPLVVVLFILIGGVQAQETLPDVNQKVHAYCKKSMGKKIDRGECWDLAKFALDHAGADWTSPYAFGKEVDLKSEEVLVGDIVQFEKVKLSNGTTYPHHTAVVYEVLEKGKYLIAHQNFNNVRKVTTIELDLSLLTKGSIVFYRPQ